MKKAESVLLFLRQHPEFILEHAEELGVRPKESKLRAFSEARLLYAEKELGTMARHMAAVQDNAMANADTFARIGRLCVALMRCNTPRRVVDALSGSLKNDFALKDFVLVALVAPGKKIKSPPDLPRLDDRAARAGLKKLDRPVCGVKLPHPALERLFPADSENESFLCLPLRADGRTLAVLAVGHPDPARFVADAPTDYVAIMGEVAGAAWARVMGIKAA